MPPDLDELAVAGALAGQPVELLPCRTVDTEFIAHAEYVIEGELLADRAPESRHGTVATPEFLGYQGRAHPSLPLIRVTGITARESPILQAVSGPGHEQSVLLGFGMEAAVLDLLRRRGTPALAAHCHTAGGGQLMVVLQWPAKRGPEDDVAVRVAAEAVLEQFRMAKLVLCVDDDVDIEVRSGPVVGDGHPLPGRPGPARAAGPGGFSPRPEPAHRLLPVALGRRSDGEGGLRLHSAVRPARPVPAAPLHRAVTSRTAAASSATPSVIRAVGSAAYPIRKVGSAGDRVTK